MHEYDSDAGTTALASILVLSRTPYQQPSRCMHNTASYGIGHKTLYIRGDCPYTGSMTSQWLKHTATGGVQHLCKHMGCHGRLRSLEGRGR